MNGVRELVKKVNLRLTNLTEDKLGPFEVLFSLSNSQEEKAVMVGAKSRNIAYLKGKVPSLVGFLLQMILAIRGVFEKLQILKEKLASGDFGVLEEIRKTIFRSCCTTPAGKFRAIFQVQELKNKMQSSGMPWPGDEGQQRWEQAWTAIKKVRGKCFLICRGEQLTGLGFKMNEEPTSAQEVRLDHDLLCMAVLVQEIINADYAFVIHTTNPSSGDSLEIYAEVVKGHGETLVGAYPGRALSFISKKDKLDSPKVLSYPSQPVGLFIRRSIIFRSDSNGEDLEGYAGAGLYDR
ncbi:alpha-glucan water dikinase [Tanacetum coccineum]